VCLYLEVIAAAENVGVPGGSLARLIVFVRQEMVRYLAGHARGRDNDALVILCQQLAIDARLGVESFRVGERRELD
jgi:hypothetical protein